MKKEKFKELWNKYAYQWHSYAKFKVDDILYNVSDFCDIADDIGDTVYEKYEVIKKVAKKLYFGVEGKRVNRFKRAAIVVYAINMSEPLKYKEGSQIENLKIDSFLLKQRLAFYVALQSVIMQYPQKIVDEIYKQDKEIYDLKIVSNGVGDGKSDTFLEGVYKDIFFSGIYQNFNVLTMSNVFLLLTERSSELVGLSFEED